MPAGAILAPAALAAAAAASLPQPSPHSVAVRVTFDPVAIRSVAARGAGADDPVRVASISKLVTALGVMRLVEAGVLDLDRDVSVWLGHPVRHPRFPDRPITLRLLLSHRAGLADGIDYAVPLGTRLRDALADPAAWDPAHGPGDHFRYANLGFPLIASVMEAATGARFDRLMTRIVFRPLALDGCFNWSGCSNAALGRAVPLIGADGAIRRDALGGRRPACLVVPTAEGSCVLDLYVPGENGALFSPQGGARLSARDLARIGQMLLKRGADFLSPASIAALAGPEWTFDGANGATERGIYCRYGLAVQYSGTGRPDCADDLFGDGRPRFGHAGEAYGLRSGLWIDPAAGTGIAYFVTGVPDDAERGRSGYSVAEEALARPYRAEDGTGADAKKINRR